MEITGPRYSTVGAIRSNRSARADAVRKRMNPHRTPRKIDPFVRPTLSPSGRFWKPAQGFRQNPNSCVTSSSGALVGAWQWLPVQTKAVACATSGLSRIHGI